MRDDNDVRTPAHESNRSEVPAPKKNLSPEILTLISCPYVGRENVRGHP